MADDSSSTVRIPSWDKPLSGSGLVSSGLCVTSQPSRAAPGSARDFAPLSAPEHFEANLPLIDSVIAFHGHHGRLSADEKEDFRSWVMLKLIENDYARIRKFEGRSSFRTFLNTTVNRLLLDYWALKGRRPRVSSLAESFAPEGIWLERYIVRDRYSLSEAIQLVKTNNRSPLSEDELHQIALRLPLTKAGRRSSSTSDVEILDARQSSPERRLEQKETTEVRQRLTEALERALCQLRDEERVYINMRFEQGCKLSEIASAFHLPRKAFYRRFHRILTRLGRLLSSYGVDASCLEGYGDGF
jgi:RNA polymerase sigma factor for flagellar operon FliA